MSQQKLHKVKTKLMINSAKDIHREIKVKEQKQSTITSFKYLRAVVSDDCSKPEVFKDYVGHCSSHEAEACLERLIESLMGLRPRQGNLRLVFRLFSLMRGLPSIRLK